MEQATALLAALRQERADAVNLRQRHQKDQATARMQAQMAILIDLLPILDNLQRAFAAPPADIADHAWVKGVLGINQQLAGLLRQVAVTPIKVVGEQFDPALMEAVSTVVDDQQPEGLVVEELLTGYLYQELVLRVAQVKVVQAS